MLLPYKMFSRCNVDIFFQIVYWYEFGKAYMGSLSEFFLLQIIPLWTGRELNQHRYQLTTKTQQDIDNHSVPTPRHMDAQTGQLSMFTSLHNPHYTTLSEILSYLRCQVTNFNKYIPTSLFFTRYMKQEAFAGN